MSLIDISQIDIPLRVGQDEHSESPGDGGPAPDADGPTQRRPGPAAVYTVVYNDPDAPAAGYPLGWTLTAHHDPSWSWSMALATRGASAHASPRVAQAVAVRVLTEQCVGVEGWSGPERGSEFSEQTAGLASFRARLVGAAPGASPPPPAHEPWRLRRIVSRQLQGH